MASELRAAGSQGLTVRARIINAAAKVWNGSAFVTYVAGDIATYAVTMTEQGSSGVYIGDFPIGVTSPGHYEYFSYALQAPPDLAETDPIIGTGSLEWDGSTEISSDAIIPGTMSGSEWYTYVLQVLKRTDKETEVFASTKDIIDDMRRRILFPDDETQTTFTDTISVLGDYRLDLESDFGMLISDILFQESAADDGYPLDKISKAEFDRRYLPFGTSESGRGRPEAYCIFGGQALIGPVPDRTDYIYTLSYGADDLAAYTIDSVSIPFTDKSRLTLRRGVLSIVFAEVLKNDEQGAKFGSLYESDLRKIERRIDRNRKSNMQTEYQGV